MQNRTQVSQAPCNSLLQSPGGCGLSSTTTEVSTGGRGHFSTATVADVATVCDASDSATVGTGDPGLSSRFTAAPVVVPRSADAPVSLPSPPFSSNGETEVPTSESPRFQITAENGSAAYTPAPEDIRSQVSRILRDMKVAGELKTLVAMRSHPKKMENSRWYVRDDVNFLATPGSAKDIYVRPCYLEIYTILHELWQGEKNYSVEGNARCILVTGTPGIGKSVFGLVLLKMVMQRTKPALIFYEPAGSNGIQIFWQGEHYSANGENARELIRRVIECNSLSSYTSYDLDFIEIWSIADAHVPLNVECINRVCITSPQPTIASGEIKKWKKNNNAIVLALPPCEWEEMIQIRSALYPWNADQRCPLDKLKERYEFWGGVPRNLIEAPDNLKEIYPRFRLLRIADVLPFLGTRSLDHSQYSEAFFHLFPTFKVMDTDQSESNMSLIEKYGDPIYWWATEAMAKQAWLQFRRSQGSAIYSNTQ